VKPPEAEALLAFGRSMEAANLHKGGIPCERAEREPHAVGSRGRALGQGVRGRSPPKAEALLAFGRSMETANMDSFLEIPCKFFSWSGQREGGIAPCPPLKYATVYMATSTSLIYHVGYCYSKSNNRPMPTSSNASTL